MPKPQAPDVIAQIKIGETAQGAVTEIALSPEELGTLRIRITGTEDSGTVLMLLDRPESYELFRRNLDLIRAELKASGWQEASIDLRLGTAPDQGSGRPNDQQAEADAAPRTTETAEAPTARPATRGLSHGHGALDLRL